MILKSPVVIGRKAQLVFIARIIWTATDPSVKCLTLTSIDIEKYKFEAFYCYHNRKWAFREF